MKSQNTQYPVSSQYDSDNVAVPINIVETTRTNSMTGEIETVYEYDLVIIKAPSTNITKQLMKDVVQVYMDIEAKTREYDGVGSLCTYTASEVFGEEARNGVIWRDACWVKGYEILNACEAGTRQIPTIDELLAEMPSMVWP